MGCNVSKDQQVEPGDVQDAIKSAGKSKNKKGKKSTTSLEVDSFNDANKKGGDTRENGTNEDKKKDTNNDNDDDDMNLDPSDPNLNAAASKIQASFRGHKVRKELKKTADEIDLYPTPKTQKNGSNPPAPTSEDAEVDLSDPEVQKAATKIQASFRGYMVRKQKDGGPVSASENSGS